MLTILNKITSIKASIINSQTYIKPLFFLIVFAAIFKIIIAAFVELGNDEVYYYTYALLPDWNYFDHPPLVGWLIQLTTLNLHWVNDITMRLGAIIGCSVSTFFIFKTGKVIANERVGWLAALLYNCSVYTGVIAGLFILPDSPQMPFWTASLYLMSIILFDKKKTNNNLFLLLGLTIGLATLSKVHGLFLWAGFGLYLITQRTAFFTRFQLYLGGLITMICLVPILLWNIKNNFITYTYHSERVTHSGIHFDTFVQEVLGEFAYQNPVIFILLVIAVLYFIRKKEIFSSAQNWWLFCMSFPMLFIFWFISLRNATLPHWSGPAYIPLFIIAAKYLDARTKKFMPLSIIVGGSLVILILISGTVLANFAPFNLGSQNKENYGEYCPTLDISGWKQFGKDFKVLVDEDIKAGRMKSTSPILVNKWFPGAHIEMYVAGFCNKDVLGIGKLDDLHQFAWLNTKRNALQLKDDAYCIVPSNLPFNVVGNYGQYFTTIDSPISINQVRNGVAVRYFYVYRLKLCKQIPIDNLTKFRIRF